MGDDAKIETGDDLVKAEKKLLFAGNDPTHSAGIALSGGGIRAATVALGVLQVLSEKSLLEKFDYISTVSGGGYIGAALSWFWSKKRVCQESATSSTRFGSGASDFPFQDLKLAIAADRNSVETGENSLSGMAASNLDFLRNHGSYLTSGDGIGFAALIVAVLRTVIISLLVWLPLLTLLFHGAEWFDLATAECLRTVAEIKFLFDLGENRLIFSFLIGVSIFVLVFFVIGSVVLSIINPTTRIDKANYTISEYFKSAAKAAASVVLLAAGYFVYTSSPTKQVGMVVLSITFLLSSIVCFVFAILIFLRPNPSYGLRRGFERWSSYTLPWSIALLFIGFLPKFNEMLGSSGILVGGSSPIVVISLLSGVATALYGYYVKAKSVSPGLAGKIFVTVGSLIFISGILLLTFSISKYIFGAYGVVIPTLFIFLALGSVVLGQMSNVNATGLHRFYRDRLMETFMPMANAVNLGAAQQSNVADTLKLSDLEKTEQDRSGRPYHLINANVILVGDKDAKVALRGGDNFLLSAGFIGSAATGWTKTEVYDAKYGPLTLATAMAASGAAANTNAGYIGTGLTREKLLSTVMSFLNIRLGVWIRNPTVDKWGISRGSATYFLPVLLQGIFGLRRDRSAGFVEISDGGHFENLGLYELIRRRLKTILVVDAEQDSTINLSALVSSLNRVKEDFGAHVEFLPKKGPEQFFGQDSEIYPHGVKVAKSPFIVGLIRYGKEQEGILIYIKSTMLENLEFSTAGYRAAYPDFPHQSTIDQFFDPDQFEAYRDLGRKSCIKMLESVDLATRLGDVSGLLRDYGFGDAPPTK